MTTIRRSRRVFWISHFYFLFFPRQIIQTRQPVLFSTTILQEDVIDLATISTHFLSSALSAPPLPVTARVYHAVNIGSRRRYTVNVHESRSITVFARDQQVQLETKSSCAVTVETAKQ